jgi:hypothetical protein
MFVDGIAERDCTSANRAKRCWPRGASWPRVARSCCTWHQEPSRDRRGLPDPRCWWSATGVRTCAVEGCFPRSRHQRCLGVQDAQSPKQSPEPLGEV